MLAYDPKADQALIDRAYIYATQMHGSQKRASGDPYYAHPIEVAGILTEYRLDTATIAAALLHDVIEDTEVTRADVESRFGPLVADIVDGVTKLSRLDGVIDYRRQGQNLQKFILAVSKDIRVLLVKLADRLHNMRTLGYIKSAAKRERIARETLELYAPLARAIGCQNICTELEELAFHHVHPVAEAAIRKRLTALKVSEQARTIEQQLEANLTAAGIAAHIAGRAKSVYSIWRKLQRKTIGFQNLSDVYAVRVVVETEADCYAALGVVHQTWRASYERFKDFISAPKANNYRSLHTTILSPEGGRVEVQIRTRAMDEVAERGVAAHWRYKNDSYGFDAEGSREEGGEDVLANLRNWLQGIEQGEDPAEFVAHARMELFSDQVFVFTPRSKLINLPGGAMPLDFAYALHSDIGDTCIAVKINNEPRSLRTVLENGDVVEIICDPTATPPADWESLVITSRARTGVRRRIRQSVRQDLARHGERALAVAFTRAGKVLADSPLREALPRFAATSERELFEAVGQNLISPAQVLDQVYPTLHDSERAAAAARVKIEDGPGARLYLQDSGLKGVRHVAFCKVCRPVPGDRIVGISDLGSGLTVHGIDCPELVAHEADDAGWRNLQWIVGAEDRTFSSAFLHATIHDSPGVMGQACTIIGEAGANIVGLDLRRTHGSFFEITFDLEVIDAAHLSHISAALRACPTIDQVDRIKA